jgi:hypothetical protein
MLSPSHSLSCILLNSSHCPLPTKLLIRPQLLTHIELLQEPVLPGLFCQRISISTPVEICDRAPDESKTWPTPPGSSSLLVTWCEREVHHPLTRPYTRVAG